MVGLAHNFMRLLGPMSILTLATSLWPRHTMSQSRRYSRQPYAYKLKIYFPKVLRSCLCYCLCFSSLMIKKITLHRVKSWTSFIFVHLFHSFPPVTDSGPVSLFTTPASTEYLKLWFLSGNYHFHFSCDLPT